MTQETKSHEFVLRVNCGAYEPYTDNAGNVWLPDQYLEEGKEWGVIDGMTVDGHLYGVPESFTAVALYYNKSMIATPPSTTDELLSLVLGGDKLVTDGMDGAYYFYGFWNAFGGQLMDDTGRCIADQGGFVPAVQYLSDLQTSGAIFQVEVADGA